MVVIIMEKNDMIHAFVVPFYMIIVIVFRCRIERACVYWVIWSKWGSVLETGTGMSPR